MSCAHCISLGIPKHLCREGKPDNVPFNDGSELIHRRFYFPELDITKSFDTLSQLDIQKLFKFMSDSCNRGAFCQSIDDVLIDSAGVAYPDYSVWSISVQTLNEEFIYTIDHNKAICKFLPVHKAEDCNYAHTELHFFVNDIQLIEKKPKPAKAAFRDLLLEKMIITKHTP